MRQHENSNTFVTSDVNIFKISDLLTNAKTKIEVTNSLFRYVIISNGS